MKVFILSSDRVFARMLSLEISAYGADTKIFDSVSPDARRFASVSDISLVDIATLSVNDNDFPEIEKTQVILFGFSEDIKNISGSVPAGYRILSRPFSVPEMLSSIFERNDETLVGVRPVKRHKSPADSLILNENSHSVTYKKETVLLTKTEYDLFMLLIQNKGSAVTRKEAALKVWGEELKSDSNLVDVYIRYLREKLDEKFGIKIISTIRGIGYSIKTE